MRHMPYTTNPHLPKLRMMAVRKVKQDDWSMRAVARYYGVEPSTVKRWCDKDTTNGRMRIETTSSRPIHHPRELSTALVSQIVTKRTAHNRSAEVVHEELKRDGITVSLSSVKRTLDRRGLTKKKSPWKRLRRQIARPEVLLPGDLVEVDTIHLIHDDGTRVYVFTLIDLCTRRAYARAYAAPSVRNALDFLRRAQGDAVFPFRVIQSDNGPEWSTQFTKGTLVTHRHTRVRKPNDNAHIERFNRTIQEECLNKLIRQRDIINRALPAYLKYYNEERLHFGLKLQTPEEVLRRY